jgi:hypothetical protein
MWEPLLDQQSINNAWFQFQDIPGVTFKLNDPVRITAGTYQGQVACVIALLKRQPEPVYLVELGATGVELEIPESALLSSTMGKKD